MPRRLAPDPPEPLTAYSIQRNMEQHVELVDALMARIKAGAADRAPRKTLMYVDRLLKLSRDRFVEYRKELLTIQASRKKPKA